MSGPSRLSLAMPMAFPDRCDGARRDRSLPSQTGSAAPHRMPLGEKLSAAMAAAQAGDADAYRTVLRDSVPFIAETARAKGVRGAAIDDVIQETLLTLHAARHTYDPARPFLPFLRAIAGRRAIDALRLKGRRSREVHDPIAFEHHPDAGSHASGLDQEDRRRVLAAAICDLPDGQREAVEHLALAERSLDETAALTGRSKGALKVNLHRALKALRVRLAVVRGRGDV